ncbi:FAD-binding oxidoreductase [Bordetella genomosp. 11]|uniref:Hydroxyacid dehydrogenase n=1 Tax=Bordetella genomosp. 11 TaxID=1416808 RepID=A0A261UM76_9BORD|nr:FAD-binding oxidoreductase [Bordetella genomosp. 11]OZI62380.1 hydroxyacid dehydrogenase [Bordetella genomosp. 11]
METELIRRLAHVVGDEGLVLDEAAQAPYVEDWLGKWRGRTPVVVRPRNTTEVAAVMRLCRQSGTPVVPQGGNTGMSGGAAPDDSGAQVILSLNRMTRIREVDPVNNTMTVDAGVLLADVQRAARDAGRYFPLSLGAEGSCTIGGNLATNAGGTAVLRYGNTRDLALGLEVVLPDGRVWSGLRGLRKDNTGYDLRGLFIGSEGTLGIITGAVLKLYPAPLGHATAWVGAASPACIVSLLSRLQAQCGERLTAFEMMSARCVDLVRAHVSGAVCPLEGDHPYHALVQLSDVAPEGLPELLERSLAHVLEDGLIADAAIAASETQARSMWRLREGISQAQVRAGKAVKHDIALPISRLAAFIDEADAALAAEFEGLPIVNFGHVGDGNLHYNVLLPPDVSQDDYARLTAALNRRVHDLVAQRGGSISAEHGVGRLRRDELRRYKSAVEMDLMLMIKRALDPDQLMNPGKLL